MEKNPGGPFELVMTIFEDISAAKAAQDTALRQAHNQLSLAEQQYRMMAENSPDLIYVIDLENNKTVYLNRETLLGYTLPELEAPGSLLSKVDPEDLDGVRIHWQKALEGQDQEAFEYRLQTKDGAWVWVCSRPRILARDGSAKPTQLLVTLSEITTQKRLQVALSQNEQHFRELYQSFPLASYTWKLRADGEIALTDVNRMADTTTQNLAHGFIGRTAREIYADRPDIVDNLARCAREKSTFSQETTYTSRSTKRTGTIIFTYVFVEPDSVMLHSENITQRKQAEEALHQSEERYRSQYQNFPLSGFTWQWKNDDFVIIDCNKKALSTTDGAAANLIGKTAKVLYSDDPRVPADLNACYSSQSVIRHEMDTVLRSTGARRRMIGTYVFVPPDLVVVYAEDITERKQAEEALRASEARFSTIFHASPDMIGLARAADGLILDANEALCEVLEVTREQIIGSSIFNPDSWLTGPTHDEFLHSTKKQGRVLAMEGPFKTRTGKTGSVLGSASIVNLNGEDCFLFFGKETTAFRQVELRLRESQARFDRVFRTSPVGICIFDLRDGRAVDFNDALLELTGYAREEVAGRTPSELNLFAYPNEQVAWAAAVAQSGSITGIETTIRRKSGELRYVTFAAAALETSAEPLAAVLLTDITALKRTEAELVLAQTNLEQRVRERTAQLRETNQFLDHLLNLSPVATSLVSLVDHVIVRVNAALEALFGYSAAELLGHPHTALDYLVDPAEYRRGAEIFSRTGRVQGHEFEYKHTSGAHGWVSVYAEMIELDGKPYVLTQFVDVTEQKRAQQAIGQLAERLELATASAHLGIWDWYIPNDQLVWDKKMCSLYGIQPEQWGGAYEDWAKRVHPDDLAMCDENLRLALLGEKEYDFEYRIVWEDGSIHWVKDNALVVRDGSGQPLRMIGVNYDITERKQTEESLQKMARLQAEGQQIAHMGTFEFDTASQQTTWSEEQYRVYGYDPAENSPDYATIVANSLYPEDAALIDQTFRQAVQDHATYQMEHRIRWPNGSQHWVFERARPYFDEHGRLSRYIGVTMDITERKQAEQALHESEEKFAKAFHTGAVLKTIVRAADYLVVEVNEGFLNLLEYTREQVVGRNMKELDLYAYPEQLESNVREMAAKGELSNQQVTLKTRTGRQVEVLASTQYMYLSGEKYAITTAVDISERVRAEQALFESREDYRSLVESLDMLIVKVDRDGRYLYANHKAAQRQGIPVEQIVGSTINEILPPRVAEMQLAKVRQVIDSGKGFTEEIKMEFADGVARWGRGSIQPVFDAHGKGIQAIVSSMDISEMKLAQQRIEESAVQLKLANAELERALRAKSEFMAAMSHELRTPLTGILGQAEILAMNLTGNLSEKQLKSLEGIENGGQRLLKLISDVMDYTWLQSAKVELDLPHCSLKNTCWASIQTIRKLADEKQQQLEFNIHPESILIRIDESRIRQVLANLLENAVKFAPKGGRIQLIVTGLPEEHKVKLTVSDTGIGIAEEDFPKLFKPFVQLDARLSRNYEGTGLGLALVKALAELHGGSVTVESVIGQGSSFCVSLPWDGALTAGEALEQIQPALPAAPQEAAEAEHLPAELAEKIRAATINANLDDLLRLAEQAAAVAPRLGARLRELVENFQYDEILALLEAKSNNAGSEVS